MEILNKKIRQSEIQRIIMRSIMLLIYCFHYNTIKTRDLWLGKLGDLYQNLERFLALTFSETLLLFHVFSPKTHTHTYTNSCTHYRPYI